MRIEKKRFFEVGRVVLIAAASALIASSTLAQLNQKTAKERPGGSLNGNTVAITVPWKGLLDTYHETYSGATLVLHGVARLAPGCSLTLAEWDPGDGSGFVPVPHGNPRVLELAHVYAAPDYTPFTATLRVTDDCGTVATDTFRVRVLEKNLDVEVNLAIDRGLWNLHKRMTLSSSGGVDLGNWYAPYSGTNYTAAATASAVQAFEVEGHHEWWTIPDPPPIVAGYDDNPYVEDVRRGLAYLTTRLATVDLSGQPGADANANGIGLYVNSNRSIYETGPVVDAFAAADSANELARTGNADVLGRTYKEIIQDMLDCYAWGQVDGGWARGGWRYSWNSESDNSAAQWWGIAAISAERGYSCIVPPFVKQENLDFWLAASQCSDGGFGYTGCGSGLSTTPSGMVQLIADGVQSDDSRFENAEHYAYAHWSSLVSGNHIYGFFAMAKAMRLASPLPLQFITDGAGGSLDWYSADTTTGDPTDGLARYLVNTQHSDGSWDSSAYWLVDDLASAFAVIVLSGTITDLGPVAVCDAEPETTGLGEPVFFDGSGSYHPDPDHHIVLWEWDLDDDGLYGEEDDPPDAVGPFASRSYDTEDTHRYSLRVWDDRQHPLFDTCEGFVYTVPPPIPPNSDPGGAYCFVLEEDEPFIVDGSNSSDPDGVIETFGWDFDPQPLDFSFDDASAQVLDLTAFFTNLGPGTYDLGLMVIDDDGLDNIDYTTVTIQAPGGGCPDPPCPCGECDPVIIDSWVNFSELDGSSVDEDGFADGTLMINGLVLEGWAKVMIDVPSAEFLVNGDVVLSGDAQIDNYSWYLPEFGPSITIKSCGSIHMSDRSRIRSHGDVYGGHIKLCAEGDIVMDFIAGIECNGFDLPTGQHGGFIDIFAGGRFDMMSDLTYITVESFNAGQIHIAACSPDDRAVSLKGRLLADGTDPGGVGGDIIVDARNGGLWLPGVGHCLATGDNCAGNITLFYRTILEPIFPPIVRPDPTIVFDGPDHGPCACTNGNK